MTLACNIHWPATGGLSQYPPLISSKFMNANLINRVWKSVLHYVHVSMALASSARPQRPTRCYWKHNPHLKKNVFAWSFKEGKSRNTLSLLHDSASCIWLASPADTVCTCAVCTLRAPKSGDAIAQMRSDALTTQKQVFNSIFVLCVV